MTPEERAFCDRVRAVALDLCVSFGAIEQSADDPAKVARMARKGALAALALCQQSGSRVTDADLQSEQADVAASDYDLTTLATAPPATIED
jgi:hypothetical protein